MKLLAFRAHKHDPLSEAIMAVTRSSYCHAAILIEPLDAKIIGEVLLPVARVGLPHLIVEEFFPHCRLRWLEPDEYAGIDVFEFSPLAGWSTGNWAGAMEYIITALDEKMPYDFADILRFLAPVRAAIGDVPEDAAKRHQFCSQFVFNVIRAGGLSLLNCHDYEFSPDKLDWSPFLQQVEGLK